MNRVWIALAQQMHHFLLAGSEQFIAWHGQAAGRNLRRCGLQLRSCIDLKAGEEGSQLRSTSQEKLDGQSRGTVRLGCVDSAKRLARIAQIGRASCRERVCQYG